MKTILAAALVMLAGCTPLINNNEFEKATKLCAPHGGLEFVLTTSDRAKCKNGVYVDYSLFKDK